MKRIIAFSLLLCMLTGLMGVCAFAENENDTPDTAQTGTAVTDIDAIIENMTVEEKAAQVMMMDFTYWYGEKVTELPESLGAAIAGYGFGGIILFADNLYSAEQTRELTGALQSVMSENGRVPLLIATDQEGGEITRLSFAAATPGSMAAAATGDSENARLEGEIIGSELNALGINTCLAPCLDVQSNPANTTIGLRSFCDNPLAVVEYGTEYIRGLHEGGVISCAKHYPGHGSTETDSHYGLPRVEGDRDTIMQSELPPYAAAAAADGADMIMTAHILYPGVDDTKLYSYKTGFLESRPATLSKIMITDILKGELGFDGVVITDAMNMLGITNTFSESQAVIEALCAGADMICMPCSGVSNPAGFRRVDAIIEDVAEAVESGYLPAERLDDAVRNILELKAKYGLLDGSYEQKDISVVACDEHAEIEREMAAKAVTVVENDGALPLRVSEEQSVLVFVPSHDMGAQIVMGVNRAIDAGLFPSSVDPVIYTFSSSDYFVSGFLKDCIDRADIVIALSQTTSVPAMAYLDWRTAGVVNIVDYCNRTGKTSIVMSIGLPYDVQLYPKADAVLAVYGDVGSNLDVADAFASHADSAVGAGPNIIAGIEVILGLHDAQGKLPVNIPVFNSITNKFTEEIVYPRGWSQDYRAFKHY